jgi:hypothetical protein
MRNPVIDGEALSNRHICSLRSAGLERKQLIREQMTRKGFVRAPGG